MAEAEQFAAVIVDAPGLGALDYRVPKGCCSHRATA